MKEYAKQPESVSRTFDKQPRASQQAPISVLINSTANENIIQRYRIQSAATGIFLAQELRRSSAGVDTFLSEKPEKANLRINGKVNLRVSDTGNLAIEDGGDKREAKIFYGTTEIQTASNQILKEIGSPIRLGINPSATVTVIGAIGQLKTLYAIYPIDVIEKKIGEDVQVPERCNESGPHILHTGSEILLNPRLNTKGWADGIKDMNTSQAVLRILDYFRKQKIIKEEQEYDKKYLFRTWLLNLFSQKEKKQEIEEFSAISHRFIEDAPEAIRPYAESIKAGNLQDIIREIGINQFCDPEVGEMLSVRSISAPVDERKDGPDLYVMDNSTGTEIKNPFPYHFAAVIAKSGSDYITMENYARRENCPVSRCDPRYFFQMYGTETKEQSFHGVMKKDYPAAMTFVYGKQSRGKQEPEYDIDSPQFGAMQEHYKQKMRYWDPTKTPILRYFSIT